MDRQRSDVTTSEGQSYTLLRAVWQGDKLTFDGAWQWTKDNLSRADDRLLSWLFGQRTDGSYGVLNAQGGANAASDADTDIALALVFAYARWQDLRYLGDARVIVRDIWRKEVVTIGGVPYLLANSVEKESASPTALINASYLAPYAYRIFAVIDPEHPWEDLVDSSYVLAGQVLDASLGGADSAGLPPDWVHIHKQTGVLTAAEAPLTTDFGYDALRMPWRFALDYQWSGDPRAKDLLAKMAFLSRTWQENGELAGTYAHDGSIIDPAETPAMYGGSIGYFLVADPLLAKSVYEQKLQYLYDPDKNTWRQILSYYDDNWAWFGIGLYHHLLPNLFESLPLELYQL